MSTKQLTPGANVPVPTTELTVRLKWAPGIQVDPEALLVTSARKVRSDDDFVFYNAPQHRSGAVALQQGTVTAAAMRVDLRAIEEIIDCIVFAGSVDTGTFADAHFVSITVESAGAALVEFQLKNSDAISAVVLGEMYRRDGGWKFRAVGQGWDTGLRGLAVDYGITVDEEPPADLPVQPIASNDAGRHGPVSGPRADWYPDPADASVQRWWDGTRYTGETLYLPPQHDPAVCNRCGQPRKKRILGTPRPCRGCENDVNAILGRWRADAANVLASSGPTGPMWESLWTSLRHARIAEASGRAILRPLAVTHLERIVTFAFADGVIEQHELDEFESSASALGVEDQSIDAMRSRLRRGLELSRIRNGDLPRIQVGGLHLEVGETVHLDSPATQVRYLASGPKENQGRLIASSRKIRFVGAGSGAEVPWVKVISVRSEYRNVVIDATTSRGSATYVVDDSAYVAAVLEGTLRVAKRLVLAPGQRDTRSIPQDVKSAVWQRDGGKCTQCGAGHYLEYDHVIPLSLGGATSVTNLQILCRQCNLAKGARI